MDLRVLTNFISSATPRVTYFPLRKAFAQLKYLLEFFARRNCYALVSTRNVCVFFAPVNLTGYTAPVSADGLTK